MRTTRPTLQNVADNAGVSVVTASKVLNGNSVKAASAETIEHIKETAARLGYMRRTPSKPELPEIGVLVAAGGIDKTNHPYYADVLGGITEAAAQSGTRVRFIHTLTEVMTEKATYRQVVESGLDNLIIVEEMFQAELEEVKKHFSSIISILPYNPPSYTNDIIVTDVYAAGRDVMRRLLDCGRKRILLMAGQNCEQVLQPDAEDHLIDGRALAYRDELNARGIPLDPKLVRDCDFRSEIAFATMTKILDEEKLDFDAVFVGDDMMAIACLKVLNKRGVKIPETVAVVGFNNQEFCQYSSPSLSTVDINSRTLGKLAIELFRLKRASEIEVPLKVIVPLTYVCRSSCGTAAWKG